VGKLRSVNLVSAAAREPSQQGLVRSKPSRGPNPKTERVEPQGPARLGPTECAVETENLKRAIASERSSRGDRCAQTRRADLTLRGIPSRNSDSGAYEGGVGNRMEATRGRRAVSCAERCERRRLPQSLKAGSTAERGAETRSKAAVSSQSSEGEKRRELTSKPVD